MANGRNCSCLIFQRPDICSTTSLESIRTCTVSAPSSCAARRPATSPWYSATLLVARPSPPRRSASTSPVSASITTAPNPAGPGLPREPPSASTITLRVTGPTLPSQVDRQLEPRASQPRLSGPDQDRTAFLAADHLVRRRVLDLRQRAAVQLQPACLAAPGSQQGGADALLPAYPLVEAEQVVRELVDQLLAILV